MENFWPFKKKTAPPPPTCPACPKCQDCGKFIKDIDWCTIKHLDTGILPGISNGTTTVAEQTEWTVRNCNQSMCKILRKTHGITSDANSKLDGYKLQYWNSNNCGTVTPSPSPS